MVSSVWEEDSVFIGLIKIYFQLSDLNRGCVFIFFWPVSSLTHGHTALRGVWLPSCGSTVPLERTIQKLLAWGRGVCEPECVCVRLCWDPICACARARVCVCRACTLAKHWVTRLHLCVCVPPPPHFYLIQTEAQWTFLPPLPPLLRPAVIGWFKLWY